MTRTSTHTETAGREPVFAANRRFSRAEWNSEPKRKDAPGILFQVRPRERPLLSVRSALRNTKASSGRFAAFFEANKGGTTTSSSLTDEGSFVFFSRNKSEAPADGPANRKGIAFT